MNKYGGGDVFRGPPYQQGYGLGGSFRRFFKWMVPLVKQHTVPMLQSGLSEIGRTALGSVGDFAKDVSQGEDVKTAATKHINTAVSNLKNQIENKLSGRGKRKHKKPKILLKKRTKKFDDIFNNAH